MCRVALAKINWWDTCQLIFDVAAHVGNVDGISIDVMGKASLRSSFQCIKV